MSRPPAVARSRQAALLVVALLGAVLAMPAAPAAADTCDGVWVVVDASELGAGSRTRCAAGDPSTGLEALEAAGFSYTFVPRHPGMVCTIDGLPDPCNNAPSDAYWSYWTASPGGQWAYSSQGAGNRDPAPGSVDGWAFGAGDPPGAPPPADDGDGGDPTGEDDGGQDPTSPPAGETSGESSGGSSGSSTGAGSTSSSGSGGGSDEGAGGATDGTADEPSDEPTPGASSPGRSHTPDEDTEEPGPTASTAPHDETEDLDATTGPPERATLDVVSLDDTGRSAGGSILGLVAGVTLVAAIAGAAVVRARRRPDPGPGS